MIAALGAFDGFHLGHARLFETAKERALEKGDDWGVVTFRPHPQSLFCGTSFHYLFTEPEREALGKYHGIPRFERIPFTRGLADMRPSDFLDWIAGNYGISGLVVGDNFRFGRGRTGNCDFLLEEGKARDWSIDILPPVKVGQESVSSTLIRQKVSMGETGKAEPLLGHPFFLSGVVVKGDQRGRSLGFPTANLAVSPEKLVPMRGVYAAASLVEGKWEASALNIGFNPTFSGIRALRVEAHLIGFEGDLYGKTLTVLLLDHLRGELQFPSVQDLVIRMHEDISEADSIWRAYASSHGPMLDRLSNSLERAKGD